MGCLCSKSKEKTPNWNEKIKAVDEAIEDTTKRSNLLKKEKEEIEQQIKRTILTEKESYVKENCLLLAQTDRIISSLDARITVLRSVRMELHDSANRGMVGNALGQSKSQINNQPSQVRNIKAEFDEIDRQMNSAIEQSKVDEIYNALRPRAIGKNPPDNRGNQYLEDTRLNPVGAQAPNQKGGYREEFVDSTTDANRGKHNTSSLLNSRAVESRNSQKLKDQRLRDQRLSNILR